MRPRSCGRPPGFSCRVGRTCGQHSPDARTFEDQVRAYSLGGSPTFKLPFSLLWTPTGVKTGCVCRAPGSACHLGHGVQSRQGPGGGWTVGRWPPHPHPLGGVHSSGSFLCAPSSAARGPALGEFAVGWGHLLLCLENILSPGRVSGAGRLIKGMNERKKKENE